jgi:hypothetical protein
MAPPAAAARALVLNIRIVPRARPRSTAWSGVRWIARVFQPLGVVRSGLTIELQLVPDLHFIDDDRNCILQVQSFSCMR